MFFRQPGSYMKLYCIITMTIIPTECCWLMKRHGSGADLACQVIPGQLLSAWHIGESSGWVWHTFHSFLSPYAGTPPHGGPPHSEPYEDPHFVSTSNT